MPLSSEGSPCSGQRARSISDGEHHECDERPERMRDWLIRMINSGRFPGLEWLDDDKTIFKVPWVHAKKRGYCRDRDAALFREWAIHSGKYRDESDPTVWKVHNIMMMISCALLCNYCLCIKFIENVLSLIDQLQVCDQRPQGHKGDQGYADRGLQGLPSVSQPFTQAPSAETMPQRGTLPHGHKPMRLFP